MRAFLLKLLSLIEKFTGRKITYVKAERSRLHNTAVKSELGFWYAGDVLHANDIAHGVLSQGTVEREGTALVLEILDGLLARQVSPLVFYDAGANTGYYSILAAYYGQGKIMCYSFEPVAEFNVVEQKSIYLNRLEQHCKIFCAALGSENRKSTMFLDGTGSSLVPHFAGNNFIQQTTVQQYRLDDLREQHSLPPPDFFKIDVEGFEFELFMGAQKTLSQFLPVVWFEMAGKLTKKNFVNQKYAATLRLLTGWGYELLQCSGSQLTAVRSTDATPSGIFMYLALHKEKHAAVFQQLSGRF